MDFNYVVTRQYLLIVVSLGELRQVFLAMKVFQAEMSHSYSNNYKSHRNYTIMLPSTPDIENISHDPINRYLRYESLNLQ